MPTNMLVDWLTVLLCPYAIVLSPCIACVYSCMCMDAYHACVWMRMAAYGCIWHARVVYAMHVCAHARLSFESNFLLFSFSLLQVNLKDFYYLSDETEMAEHVVSYGTLSVCVDGSTWSSYTGGILSSCGSSVNHCVQIVGVNLEENYWLVSNSIENYRILFSSLATFGS